MAMPDENRMKPARRSPKRDRRFRGLFRRVPPIAGGVDTFPVTHGRVGD